ncbi:hypothetical protein HK100_001374 [Physocladia obscura]|uniref:Uncharacterized protein n=1 Tax=Physocladia obscura TaxID=109957 RepID=A0AAD5T2W0_9FUNG|nr:hypothetical protein HK100_001374 [Physocladia obscura]
MAAKTTIALINTNPQSSYQIEKDYLSVVVAITQAYLNSATSNPTGIAVSFDIEPFTDSGGTIPASAKPTGICAISALVVPCNLPASAQDCVQTAMNNQGGIDTYTKVTFSNLSSTTEPPSTTAPPTTTAKPSAGSLLMKGASMLALIGLGVLLQ